MAAAARELAAAGVEPARVEAELLVAHVLDVPRGRLALADPLGPDQLARLRALVHRRAAREPLQHLTGRAAFRHLELAVGPGVFVPRPETELLAGWGIGRARAATATRPPAGTVGAGGTVTGPLVVDLCSGSGAIALAVAQEVPAARVVAVERSPEALVWLRRNVAERAAAGDRPVEVVVGDVTDPDLLAGLAGTVDVLLCNPPYVPRAVAVPPEVAGHDPDEAVFAGADGLAVIRPLVAVAARLLRPGGGLGVEHDDSHGRVVPDLFAADGRFTDVGDHADLAGRPRYATASRRSDASHGAGGTTWQTFSS
ncbi:protein-(glutamine-N5) methyltransferase, release factor-specific [Micromonospora rosaria]|uniref:Release factor glutamine methyltransferase n=1 Tax=Micromonospora rosaria TaxID=47874 RepID=A0A136PW25_9ACTN|nr:peptide chain release factor N(5)-glutamine methyltransferase [Micromonospora rosaria]KXK62366.1 protein-(glutamine-N5) methyltransferase, release factor-specific [Micromonospora rosaria]